MTAAGLASRLGFSFDEIEDLRLAIDELCFGLTGAHRAAGHRRVALSDPTRPARNGRRVASSRIILPGLSELSEVILSALVDEHDLTSGPEGPRFRLVKRRHSDAAVSGE